MAFAAAAAVTLAACDPKYASPARTLTHATDATADVRDHLNGASLAIKTQTAAIRPDVRSLPQVPPRLDAIDTEATRLLDLARELDVANVTIATAQQQADTNAATIRELQAANDTLKHEADASLRSKLAWIIGTFTLLLGLSIALVYFAGRKAVVAPIACAAVLVSALTVRVAIEHAGTIAATLGLALVSLIVWYAVKHRGLVTTVKLLQGDAADATSPPTLPFVSPRQ